MQSCDWYVSYGFCSLHCKLSFLSDGVISSDNVCAICPFGVLAGQLLRVTQDFFECSIVDKTGKPLQFLYGQIRLIDYFKYEIEDDDTLHVYEQIPLIL